MSRFENWYDLPDVAARLGLCVRTLRRVLATDDALQASARLVCGQWRLPESALVAWLERQPRWGSLERRVVAPRPSGRETQEPVTARNEGELRRKVQTSGQLKEAAG